PGCSTISAGRLSFRVRNGYRAFPCRYRHRQIIGTVCVLMLWVLCQILHSGRVHTNMCVLFCSAVEQVFSRYVLQTNNNVLVVFVCWCISRSEERRVGKEVG